MGPGTAAAAAESRHDQELQGGLGPAAAVLQEGRFNNGPARYLLHTDLLTAKQAKDLGFLGRALCRGRSTTVTGVHHVANRRVGPGLTRMQFMQQRAEAPSNPGSSVSSGFFSVALIATEPRHDIVFALAHAWTYVRYVNMSTFGAAAPFML